MTKIRLAAALSLLATVAVAELPTPAIPHAPLEPADPALIPVTPTPGFRPAHPGDWMQMHQHHLNLGGDYRDAQIVLLGDSVTQAWGTKPKFEGANKKIWDTHFGRWKTLNLGIAGDKTQNILWRVENGELDCLQPQLIILAVGVNNVWNWKVPASAIAQGVKKCVESIRAKCPETKVLVVPPFPNGDTAAQPERRRTARINAELTKLNLDDGKMIRTLALWRAFLRPGGDLDTSIMSDFLHPTAAGYGIYARALDPVVAELMK